MSPFRNIHRKYLKFRVGRFYMMGTKLFGTLDARLEEGGEGEANHFPTIFLFVTLKTTKEILRPNPTPWVTLYGQIHTRAIGFCSGCY